MNISEFDLSTLFANKYNRIAIIETNNDNKSKLIKKLSQVFLSLSSSSILTIAPADKESQLYNNIDVSMNVHYKYKSEIVNNLLQIQTCLINKGVDNFRTMLILDDCISSNKFFNKKEIKTLFFEARFYQLTWILATQFPISVPTEQRANLDYIFLLDSNDINKLYHDYAGMFPNFDEFKNMFSNAIDKYGCVLIVNCVYSLDINKKVFYININQFT
jgi:hypothetical protein